MAPHRYAYQEQPGLKSLGENRHYGGYESEVDHVSKPIDIELLVDIILKHAPDADRVPDYIQPAETGDQKMKTPPSETANVIDWQALLERFQGRDAFVRKLADSILRNHMDTPQKLRQAARNGDTEQLRMIAHNLKSIGGNLEARNLEELAIKTQQSAKDNEPGATDMGLELASALEQVIDVLQASDRS